MKRKHRWGKHNAFGYFRYGGALKQEAEKPPDYRFDEEQQRFLSDDKLTAIGDASIFGQASDEPYPQADLGTDADGNARININDDKPYVFQEHDEWEAVRQFWEFSQQLPEEDEENPRG